MLVFISNNLYASESVIVNGYDNDLNSTIPEHNHLWGAGNGRDWDSTESRHTGNASTSGTFSDLRVFLDIAPDTGGGVQSYTFEVFKNGSPTSLTCAILDTATSCADVSNSFTVSGGDFLTIKSIPSGSPVATGMNARWTLKFDGDTAKESMLAGGSGGDNLSTGSTRYGSLVGNRLDSNEDDIEVIVPTSGTVKNLYARLQNGSISSGSYAFSVRVNGSTSIVTCSVTAQLCNDTVNSVAVTAGQTINISVVPSTPNAGRRAAWGVTFVSDTDGEFIIASHVDDILDGGATEYFYPSAADDTLFNIESDFTQLAQEMIIKKMYVLIESSPGAGNSYTFTLKKDSGGGSSDTALNVVISDSETGDNSASDINISDDDLLIVAITPASGPSTSNETRFSFLGFIDPGGVPPATRRIFSL